MVGLGRTGFKEDIFCFLFLLVVFGLLVEKGGYWRGRSTPPWSCYGKKCSRRKKNKNKCCLNRSQKVVVLSKKLKIGCKYLKFAKLVQTLRKGLLVFAARQIYS